jgi:hypothetical protein
VLRWSALSPWRCWICRLCCWRARRSRCAVLKLASLTVGLQPGAAQVGVGAGPPQLGCDVLQKDESGTTATRRMVEFMDPPSADQPAGDREMWNLTKYREISPRGHGVKASSRVRVSRQRER